MAPRKFAHLDSPEEVKRTARGEMPLSSAPMYSGATKVLAEVQEYDNKSDTYLVMTRGSGGAPRQAGGKSLPGVPRRVDDPGSIIPLETGTVVIVDFSLGFPYIDGVLNLNATKEAPEFTPRPPSLSSDGSVDTGLSISGANQPGYYRSIYTPEDVVQGDWVRASPDGNYVGILRGKENRMYSGEKAQISTNGLGELIRLICTNYEQFNGFGYVKVTNANGRNNVEIRGGADELSETGGEEEQWTFHLDIGDKGELFDMRVTSMDGKILSQVKLTPDGQIRIMAVRGIDLVNADGAPRSEEIGGDHYKRVAGSVKDSVGGSKTTTVEGAVTRRISETDKKVVGNDEVSVVNRNKVRQVGGNKIETITGGDPLLAEPTNKAVDIQVLNGSYFIDIGNPTAGASSAAVAGFNVYVYNGGIVLGEHPLTGATLATVSLNTSLPGSVALGGTVEPGKNIAKDTAMLFTPFSTMMGTLIGLLDSHTHEVVGTKTGPAAAPAQGGFSSALTSQIPKISSVRVLMGG